MVSERHGHPSSELTQEGAQQIARVMGALSTASRVRILAQLRGNPRTVGDLATNLGIEQPSVSHQLRVLRDLGLVAGERSGRSVAYRLYDSHVAGLVDEAMRHIEHFAARAPDPDPGPETRSGTRTQPEGAS